MNYQEMITDELTDIREVEHRHKNYTVSDAIRSELDSRGSFCIDTPNGQEVYHMGDKWAGKRKEFMQNIKSINDKFKRI